MKKVKLQETEGFRQWCYYLRVSCFHYGTISSSVRIINIVIIVIIIIFWDKVSLLCPWLFWNSLCRPCWFWTHRDPPASASWVLGLKALCHHLLAQFSDNGEGWKILADDLSTPSLNYLSGFLSGEVFCRDVRLLPSASTMLKPPSWRTDAF